MSVFRGFQLQKLKEALGLVDLITQTIITESGTGGALADIIGGGGSGDISGSGAAGQITFWDGTKTITGDTGLLWDNLLKTLTASGDVNVDGDVTIDGDISFKSNAATLAILEHSNSANRIYTLPDATGTVALVSDIPAEFDPLVDPFALGTL